MTSLVKITAAFLLLMLVLPSSAQRRRPESVSIIQLIANPKAHQGKFVRVIGFVTFEFEGTSVYLHQDDYKYRISKNALWLDIGKSERRDHLKFDKSYALVEGTFDAQMTGHFGVYSGGLKSGHI